MGGDGARYDDDIYLFCAVRHVQRAHMPEREQVGTSRRATAIWEQDVQLRGPGVSSRPGVRYVPAVSATDLPDGTTQSGELDQTGVRLKHSALGGRGPEIHAVTSTTEGNWDGIQRECLVDGCISKVGIVQADVQKRWLDV